MLLFTHREHSNSRFIFGDDNNLKRKICITLLLHEKLICFFSQFWIVKLKYLSNCNIIVENNLKTKKMSILCLPLYNNYHNTPFKKTNIGFSVLIRTFQVSFFKNDYLHNIRTILLVH